MTNLNFLDLGLTVLLFGWTGLEFFELSAELTVLMLELEVLPRLLEGSTPWVTAEEDEEAAGDDLFFPLSRSLTVFKL